MYQFIIIHTIHYCQLTRILEGIILYVFWKRICRAKTSNQCLYVVTSYHCLTKINSEENRDFIVHIGMLFYFTNWFLIIKGGRQKWNTIGHNKKDMKNQFLYKLGFINGDVHRNIHQTRHLHCAHVSSDNDLCAIVYCFKVFTLHLLFHLQ